LRGELASRCAGKNFPAVANGAEPVSLSAL